MVVLIKAAVNCHAVVSQKIVTAVVDYFLVDAVTELHYLVLSVHWGDSADLRRGLDAAL